MLLGGPCDLPRFPDSKVGMLCEKPRHGYYFMAKQQFLDELFEWDVDKGLSTPACKPGYVEDSCLRIINSAEVMVLPCTRVVGGLKMMDPSCEFDKRRRMK